MSTTLDFNALVSRNHEPSQIARVVPRSALDPALLAARRNLYRAGSKDANNGVTPTVSFADGGGDVVYYLVDDSEDGDASGDSKNDDSFFEGDGDEVEVDVGDDDRWAQYLKSDLERAEQAERRREARSVALQRWRDAKAKEARKECEDLARSLVRRTEYVKSQRREQRRRKKEERERDGEDEKDDEEESEEEEDGVLMADRGMPSEAEQARLRVQKWRQERSLPPVLHGIEQDDWESKIDWEGGASSSASVSAAKTAGAPSGRVDPNDLLNQVHNPALESMDFSSFVSWDGADAPAGYNEALADAIPLILEDGVAGSSVARLAVPPNRPVPLSRTDVYIKRYEKEMSSPAASTSGILGATDEKLAEIIAQRQAKRAMMAIDKSKRVTDAMGTLALGGGKGRAITSSLMGPGGTERTGRPSKHVGSSSAYDAELVEHLDLVYNHTLVRPDLKKSELRQFHRPRLPRSVVRKGRTWQLQVRVNAGGANKGAKAGAGGAGGTVIGGSASAAMGTHPGAISQAKIRNEADLSPAEGILVLFEYCEERPPVQMSKGMACKIVNFYRGDKTKCPISAGGGARPPRKRPGEKASSASSNSSPLSGKTETPRLVGPAEFDPAKVSSLIGVRKKKTKGAAADADKKESSVDVLPEGITEILHPKIHGPFIGTVDEGTTQSGLLCNLFAAPIFRHEPEQTDFLMVLGKKPSHHKHQYGPSLSVVLRPFPTSVFCVGQTEPKVKVFAPNTTGEKNFTAPFVTYQIAKALTRTETKEGRGLRFDEINDRLFANTELLPNALRQRIKQVAIYDKNTQIWTSKELGYEDYPGVEALGRRFSPEGVAAYESACAYVRRLCDLGIHDLHSGTGGVQSVGQAMVYFNGAVNAARERKSKMAKMAEFAKNSKSKNQRANQTALYEMAAAKLEAAWKEMRQKLDVARFIYEELQLAPWTLTQEFIDIHKNAQGTAMMRLTGLGDPSGRGEGYNFLREIDTKPNKLTGNTDGALNAQIKKITGTENDLRKLTMKQMASLLGSYGMGQKQIDTLKRWDRVHCIRDLSTKAASDGMGDGLERYARGEKMKLSDQKQMYRDRIQEIWKRQRAALSTDAGAFDAAARGAAKPTDGTTSTPGATSAPPLPAKQQKDDDMDDSDSESDDDLAAALEEDMMDVRETNMLVADHVRGDNDLGPGGLARTGDNQEMSKDARELAALKRQREEERLAREGLLSKAGGADGQDGAKLEQVNRKCIRRRVTKTLPDGSQTTTFEFIVRQGEVEKIIAKKKEDEKKKGEVAEKGHDRKKKHTKSKSGSKAKNDFGALDEFVGHAMFEDEDDADHRMNKPNIKLQLHRSTRVVTKKTKKVNRVIRKAPPKPSKLVKRPKVHMGKLKQKLKEDKKIKKRRREEEEADLYSSAPHRKGTSNRRERGAARHRMPHVILSNRIEDIRSEVERRPNSGPFQRPVDRRLIPRYYEVISEPIDLQTIRDKNQRYEYKTVSSFVRDFELMKNNAIKFNGVGSILGNEATAMYEHVKNTVESHREEFTRMEEAVQDQLNGDSRKKKKGSTSPVNEVASSGNGGSNIGSAVNTTADVSVDGVTTTLNLGSIPTDFSFDGGDDSDSDDSAINFAGV